MARRARRILTLTTAFWDASALVPLCTQQPLSALATNLCNTFGIAVWWATPVEMASALSRLMRMAQIDLKELTSAKQIAITLENDWSVVRPSEMLRIRASAHVSQFGLRAGDALQLAAALQWCENQPTGRIFLTADDRLREAARLTGFDTSHL